MSKIGFILRPLSLASPFVITWSSLCVLISSSYKDTSHVGLGPTSMTPFYLNYLFKRPFPTLSASLDFESAGPCAWLCENHHLFHVLFSSWRIHYQNYYASLGFLEPATNNKKHSPAASSLRGTISGKQKGGKDGSEAGSGGGFTNLGVTALP